jgi:hypothetical protein
VLAVAALLLAACEESLTAPGACPNYCPGARIDVLDSLYLTSVGRDSAFRGYVTGNRAFALQIVSEGDPAVSRGLVRFFALNDTVFEGNDALPVASIDSFRVSLTLRFRPTTVEGLELVLHQLPNTADSLSTWNDLVPLFDDSTIVAAQVIPDTLESGTLDVMVPGDSLPGFLGDDMVATFGVALRSDSAGFVELGTRDNSESARLTMFVQADSSGENVERTLARLAEIDTYVIPPRPAAGPNVLAVGGLPSARSLLRVTIPSRVLDSSSVVRATLLLVPVIPAVGPPRDSIRLRADPMTADVGAKSPIVVNTDTLQQELVRIPPGWSDTVRLDITRLVRAWQGDSTFPRSLMLRVAPEGGTVSEVRFHSSRSAVGRPALRLTYVPITAAGAP